MTLKRFRQKKYPSYALGDKGPGGGMIFLTPTSVGNATGMYFEVARNIFYFTDTIPIIDLRLLQNISIPSASDFGSSIGSGKKNTRILKSLYPNETGSCLSFVRDFNRNGKNDWFMPSRGEVEAIYDLALLNETQNAFAGCGYYGAGWGSWATSTPSSGSTESFQFWQAGPFEAGWATTDAFTVGYQFFVFPVRSFHPYGI